MICSDTMCHMTAVFTSALFFISLCDDVMGLHVDRQTWSHSQFQPEDLKQSDFPMLDISQLWHSLQTNVLRHVDNTNHLKAQPLGLLDVALTHSDRSRSSQAHLRRPRRSAGEDSTLSSETSRFTQTPNKLNASLESSSASNLSRSPLSRSKLTRSRLSKSSSLRSFEGSSKLSRSPKSRSLIYQSTSTSPNHESTMSRSPITRSPDYVSRHLLSRSSKPKPTIPHSIASRSEVHQQSTATTTTTTTTTTVTARTTTETTTTSTNVTSQTKSITITSPSPPIEKKNVPRHFRIAWLAPYQSDEAFNAETSVNVLKFALYYHSHPAIKDAQLPGAQFT